MTEPAADLLRAAAQRLRDIDDTWWRGTPYHRLIPATVRLLDEAADDWQQCPEDHPGTQLDNATLNLARAVLGTPEATP